MFGASDMGVFFADFGKDTSVEFGGVMTPGIFNQPQKITLADRGFGGFDAVVPTVTLPFNAFSPMPAEMDTINVGGQNYIITEQTAESDGGVIVYSLKGPIS